MKVKKFQNHLIQKSDLLPFNDFFFLEIFFFFFLKVAKILEFFQVWIPQNWNFL